MRRVLVERTAGQRALRHCSRRHGRARRQCRVRDWNCWSAVSGLLTCVRPLLIRRPLRVATGLDPQLVELIPGQHAQPARSTNGGAPRSCRSDRLAGCSRAPPAAEVGQRPLLLRKEGSHERPCVAAAVRARRARSSAGQSSRVVERKVITTDQAPERPREQSSVIAGRSHCSLLDLRRVPPDTNSWVVNSPPASECAQLLEQRSRGSSCADCRRCRWPRRHAGWARCRRRWPGSRDHRVLVLGDLDLADLAGPVAALFLQNVLPSRPRIGERKVPWFSAARRCAVEP